MLVKMFSKYYTNNLICFFSVLNLLVYYYIIYNTNTFILYNRCKYFYGHLRNMINNHYTFTRQYGNKNERAKKKNNL